MGGVEGDNQGWTPCDVTEAIRNVAEWPADFFVWNQQCCLIFPFKLFVLLQYKSLPVPRPPVGGFFLHKQRDQLPSSRIYWKVGNEPEKSRRCRGARLGEWHRGFRQPVP